MKKITIAVLVFILGLTGSALAELSRNGGAGGSYGGGGGSSYHSSGFSRSGSGYSGSGGGNFNYGRSNIGNMSRSARSLGMPSYGPRGESFHSSFIPSRSMSANGVRNNMEIARSRSFESNVRNYDARENVVGRYYWHNYDGRNFCHYHDRWGCNWYGWYFGNSFFWTCWWDNYWWWYDPYYYRWCYWDDGWYWEDPYDYEVYVYENGQYVPVENTDENPAPANENSYNPSDNTQESQAPPMPENTTASANSVPSIKSYESLDHARMVKVVGDSHDAFLYDISKNPTFTTARYLASGVQDVRFSNTANGKPLRIMLGFTDGSFQLYNANGKLISNQ